MNYFIFNRWKARSRMFILQNWRKLRDDSEVTCKILFGSHLAFYLKYIYVYGRALYRRSERGLFRIRLTGNSENIIGSQHHILYNVGTRELLWTYVLCLIFNVTFQDPRHVINLRASQPLLLRSMLSFIICVSLPAIYRKKFRFFFPPKYLAFEYRIESIT